MIEVSHIFAMG